MKRHVTRNMNLFDQYLSRNVFSIQNQLKFKISTINKKRPLSSDSDFDLQILEELRSKYIAAVSVYRCAVHDEIEAESLLKAMGAINFNLRVHYDNLKEEDYILTVSELKEKSAELNLLINRVKGTKLLC